MRALVLLVLFFASNVSAGTFDHSHKNWNLVLKEYQNKDGLVQYGKLKVDTAKNPSSHPFVTYVADLQKVNFSEFESWPKNEKMAFLINAYNAMTFKLIVDHYPVASIKKIGGLFGNPWKLKFFSLLDGKIKTIDPIEHEWLRPVYKDYRIHAAVNCASISCPPLRDEAFIAQKLEAQLDDQMKKWINDPIRNQFAVNENTLKVSKIFDWYKKDFVDWGGGVANVFNKYLTTPIPLELQKKTKIKYQDYNWDLNEARLWL